MCFCVEQRTQKHADGFYFSFLSCSCGTAKQKGRAFSQKAVRRSSKMQGADQDGSVTSNPK